jgi:hypothetical protein
MPQGKHKKLLTKKAKKGNKGFPIATIAYYGLNNRIATKIVCAIIKFEGAEKVLSEVLSFIGEQEVKSVVVNEQIMGCPHEEGIDYKEGKSCPKCRYWAGRDRFTYNRIQ